MFPIKSMDVHALTEHQQQGHGLHEQHGCRPIEFPAPSSRALNSRSRELDPSTTTDESFHYIELIEP